jgi:sulfur carrier protein
VRCTNTHKSLDRRYYFNTVIEITVNGKAQSHEAPLVLSALLERLSLAGKKIAVERNGEIVPRGQHAATELANGDRLEIVVAVGGG